MAKNLLNQDFTASKADERWAADITYLWTGEGWLYLAVVLDLFSRRIVGSVAPAQQGPCRRACTRSWCWARWPWHFASAALIAGCCTIATRSPSVTEGSQYASTDYQTQLEEAQIACSMSRRGNCFDNAVVESFFGTLKNERLHRCRFATREAARREVFEYIEVWYNRHRRHSSLGYVSPAEFERKALAGATRAGDLSSTSA